MAARDGVGEADVVVVGSGPNGLTAAAVMARAGLSVLVLEAAPTVGGGTRTAELTLPGFRHDVCAAVHPLGAGSPVFDALDLTGHGLAWVHPELPLAHPFDDGSAAVLSRSVEETAASLGRDAGRYRSLVGPLADRWGDLAPTLLRPAWAAVPRDPLLLGRLGARSALPAAFLPRVFHEGRAPALLAAMAGHAMAPLTAPTSTGIALVFALAAHAAGWPVARGGSQAVADALVRVLEAHGGRVVIDHAVRSWSDLPQAAAYLFDTSPTALAAIARDRLPDRYLRRLGRYRYGAAAYKLDYALGGPVPWAAPECRRAGTVHLGPTHGDIGAALSSVHQGRPPDPPFLIAAQPSLHDPTRAPEGRHTFWVYAHVPHGWAGDLTGAVERQLERFAPGFGDVVLERRVSGPAELEAGNANYVGGDIACGSATGLRLLTRPHPAWSPHATPDPATYLCSAATPPGPGVHGMSGYHAARTALRRRFGIDLPLDPVP